METAGVSPGKAKGLRPVAVRLAVAAAVLGAAAFGRAGRFTFFASEGNSIYKKDTGGKPLTVWPSEAEPRSGYPPTWD